MQECLHNSINPHDVAELLKCYCTILPGGLFQAGEQLLLTSTQGYSKQQKIEILQSISAPMPLENRETLACIIEHFVIMASTSSFSHS